MLLGSGGAGRAAAVQCMLAGCARLYIGNRTPTHLQDLIAVLGAMPGGERVQPFILPELPQWLPEQGLLINATSLGLQSDDPAPIDLAQLPTAWKVYDMIYNPPVTALLKQARTLDRANANGLSMLVHQGARSLEIWSHHTVDAQMMMAAARHALELPPRDD